jgi:hypothetical protein
MDLENVYVVDIEADGLLDTVTKIHILSMGFQKEDGEWGVRSTTDYEDMKRLVCDPDNVIVGHNFILYDAPVLEKVLGVKIEATLICTLGLSWALFPWKNMHGLEHWGEQFGVPKVEVDDGTWKGLREEELSIIEAKGDKTPLRRALCKIKSEFDALMKERCEEDVKINVNTWISFLNKLGGLYRGDEHIIPRYVAYITDKMKKLRVQEMNPLRIDVKKLEENIAFFEKLKEEKIEAIRPAMPKVPQKITKKRPKNPYKKDMTLSKAGERWFSMLREMGLPEDYEGEVEVITKYKEPNPQSHSQIKDWLFSLGWKPKIYKPTTSKDPEKEGDTIPQVRIDGMLCESVLKLSEIEPAIDELDGLSVITHRLGVLNGFKKNLKGEYVVASAGGLTNTLRLKHRSPVVNLPGVLTPNDHEGERPLRDGRYIRAEIIAEEGKLFMGSDMSSLEDRSKQHFIYPYDPEYVRSMMAEDFDPHLDLAVYAKALTEQQAQDHKDKKEDYSSIRSSYKVVNYSATYGIGATKLSENLGCSMKEAQKLIEDFWGKNWAVRRFAEDQKTVKYGNEEWIINPLNGFRYWLKSEKDRFSTLNQGGATYIFDLWLYKVHEKGVDIGLQYHDELGASNISPESREEVHRICKESVREVNESLGLLRDMDCDIQFGDSYAECH